MRNGVVAPMYVAFGPSANPSFPPLSTTLLEALDATVLHGIITHYAPIAALCCFIHTTLIFRALSAPAPPTTPPAFEDVTEILTGTLQQWKQQTTNPSVQSVMLCVWRVFVHHSCWYASTSSCLPPLTVICVYACGSMQWISKVGEANIIQARDRLLNELKGFESFNPYLQGMLRLAHMIIC